MCQHEYHECMTQISYSVGFTASFLTTGTVTASALSVFYSRAAFVLHFKAFTD